jgi:hypothetical protein
MKKRAREISVDGHNYAWLVDEAMWPEGVLRVWKAEHPRKLWIEHRDKIIEPITPRLVAERIKRQLAMDKGDSL